MRNKQNIALIFFSRSSGGEAKHKSWFKQDSKNHEVASLLIKKAENEVQKSGIPVYHFHEKNQKGNNFGERIANAYKEVFDLGYQQVISVGNDCSNLQFINWRDICDDLSVGKSVLGPDKRGGAYLIGIQKKAFDQKRFEKLNWQKNTLHSELSEFCTDSTVLVELNSYRDINSLNDIRILLKIKKSVDQTLKLLFHLLKPFKELVFEYQTKPYNFHLFNDSPLRAPPVKVLMFQGISLIE